MAKKVKEVVEEKKPNLPAPVAPKKAVQVKGGGAALPAALAKKMEKDAGKGVSTAQDDNLVPLIYILQAQSPQCNKRNPAYLDGGEAGAIWLRNFSDPIVKGEEGILVQPCFFSKDWVEWVPRDSGGGYVGRHASLPADAKKVEDEKNPNKVKYVRKNKNEVIETRYHVVRVFTASGIYPYVIPMASSGHTVSRSWMFMMNSLQLPDGGKAPSFAKLYRIRTKERTNAAGTWFTWDITDAGWVPDEENYDAGKGLYEAFAKGDKAIEAEASRDLDDADADGAM